MVVLAQFVEHSEVRGRQEPASQEVSCQIGGKMVVAEGVEGLCLELALVMIFWMEVSRSQWHCDHLMRPKHNQKDIQQRKIDEKQRDGSGFE